MATATIHVLGDAAPQQAEALRGALASDLGSSAVSEVELQKGPDILALITLLIGGIQAADAIWKWWQSRKDTGVRIRIVLDKGQSIELAGTNLEALELALGGSPENES